MGGEVSTDFKSSNGIEISWLVQVLLNFDWFQGVPPWGIGGLDWGMVGGCPPHTCTHTRMHACARACDIIGNSQGFPQWGLPFAIEIIKICACVCNVHIVGGTPQTPHPLHSPPQPPDRREPETPKFNKLELIEISLFEDSLPLNIPELIDYSWSPQTPPTHLPHPPEPRKAKLEELQNILNESR